MPQTMGVDIAWDRPSITAIQATGAKWVARYLSPDASKNLKASEVLAYAAAGIDLVTVWESTATRALDGFHAGQADARAAEAQRIALGLGDAHVHHFAVDTDTDWTPVAPYFQGVSSVLPQARIGVYGGLKVINGAHAARYRYLWQTVAWSGGVWSPYATIRQPGGTVLAGAADIDYALAADYGQTPRPAPPKPTPSPAPAPNPHPKETDMVIVTVARPGTATGAPKGTPWPGDFLLADGKLNHIATPADEASFRAAGIPGPVEISWAQYQSLTAGK